MLLTKEVYFQLMNCFPIVPPEAGGILGSGDGGKTITHFVFDRGNPRYDCAIYNPDVVFLNERIDDFARSGVVFCGMVHSHPVGQRELSSEDKMYIKKVLAVIPEETEKLYFPLVIPNKELIPFVAHRVSGSIIKTTYKVI